MAKTLGITSENNFNIHTEYRRLLKDNFPLLSLLPDTINRQLCILIIFIILGQLTTCSQVGQLSEASLEFARRLYQQVAQDSECIVFSPLNIHSTLSLAYLGAHGKTAKQMAKTLGITSKNDFNIHTEYRHLFEDLNDVRDVEVYTASALYINPKFSIKDVFIKEAHENYFSDVAKLDFTSLEGPEKSINDFIARKTQNQITDFLKKGIINNDTALVLINTLFFNGTWKIPFNKILTQKQKFHQLNGTNCTVDMMRSRDIDVELKADDELDVDIVRLCFENPRFGFYIVLPREVEGIINLDSSLSTPLDVENLLTGLKPAQVSLSLPKFKIETSLELNNDLKQMGIKDAFTDKANFKGISSSKDLLITDVLHKAVIEVQETGTVASAVTSVDVSLMSATHIRIVADHPFLFFLRDNESKQILFQGKLYGTPDE